MIYRESQLLKKSRYLCEYNLISGSRIKGWGNDVRKNTYNMNRCEPVPLERSRLGVVWHIHVYVCVREANGLERGSSGFHNINGRKQEKIDHAHCLTTYLQRTYACTATVPTYNLHSYMFFTLHSLYTLCSLIPSKVLAHHCKTCNFGSRQEI